MVEAKVDVRDAPAWATFENAMQRLEGTEQAAASSASPHRPADHPSGSSVDSSDDEADPLQRSSPPNPTEGGPWPILPVHPPL